ncbi:hypothetical protein [Mycolicibacterium mageritense]|uniref:Uncharacterized protein n=1 Tax=Mycolicibacterium mageritense TaxID=53462 RepID=A0AAI8U2L7_MYCME|nr:hypothetical protein [Mycolicibacterium mageritense]BDY32990.1 hypothetical protein hbim_06962 [Mycolicibacterium mageritense]
MSVSERWTNEVCKRGARVKIRRTETYVEQQGEPFEVEDERVCCVPCERESA